MQQACDCRANQLDALMLVKPMLVVTLNPEGHLWPELCHHAALCLQSDLISRVFGLPKPVERQLNCPWLLCQLKTYWHSCNYLLLWHCFGCMAGPALWTNRWRGAWSPPTARTPPELHLHTFNVLCNNENEKHILQLNLFHFLHFQVQPDYLIQQKQKHSIKMFKETWKTKQC